MLKRPAEESVIEEPLWKKLQLMSEAQISKEIDEKEKVVKSHRKILLRKKSNFLSRLNDAENAEEDAYEARDRRRTIRKNIFSLKKRILELQSIKNRLLTPVQLNHDVCVDVFQALIEQQKNQEYYPYPKIEMDFMAKYFLVGKETFSSVVALFKRTKSIEFGYGHTKMEIITDFCKFEFDFTNFTKKLFEIAISCSPKVCFSHHQDLELQNWYFQTLLKHHKQRKLEIVTLKQINEIVVQALEKLHGEGILIEFCDISVEILQQLPALKFETLHHNHYRSIDYLVDKSFGCSFRTINFCDCCDIFLRYLKENIILDYIEEITVHISKSSTLFIGKLLEKLSKSFPNAKKITIDFDRNLQDLSDYYFKKDVEFWQTSEKEIEEAKQSEVLVNVNFRTTALNKLDSFFQELNAKKINTETYQWTSASTTNELKFIKFCYNPRAFYIEEEVPDSKTKKFVDFLTAPDSDDDCVV